jgi:hypothetical protein
MFARDGGDPSHSMHVFEGCAGRPGRGRCIRGVQRVHGLRLCYVEFGLSYWPYVVPGVLTLTQAAAPLSALHFVGVALALPIILLYSGYNYWVFRGKAASAGYH